MASPDGEALYPPLVAPGVYPQGQPVAVTVRSRLRRSLYPAGGECLNFHAGHGVTSLLVYLTVYTQDGGTSNRGSKDYGILYPNLNNYGEGEKTLAEGVGFEPTVSRPTPVFKTGAIVRSAIPPQLGTFLSLAHFSPVRESGDRV